MDKRLLNKLIVFLSIIIILQTSYILYTFLNPNANRTITPISSSEDFNNLNSLISLQKLITEPNQKISHLKKIANFYENFLSNSKQNENLNTNDLINFDLAITYQEIKEIYSNNQYELFDINKEKFDSNKSRLILANSFSLKSFYSFLKIENFQNFKDTQIKLFCEVFEDVSNFIIFNNSGKFNKEENLSSKRKFALETLNLKNDYKVILEYYCTI